MKKINLVLILILAFSANVFSQEKKESIIFGLVFDGDRLDPIAFVKEKKLVSIDTAGGLRNVRDVLVKNYYPLKTRYSLLFGGVANGNVTISDNHKGDCSGNSANVRVNSKIKLTQTSPTLATNVKVPKMSANFRRFATFVEKQKFDLLVKAEFAKHNIIGKKIILTNLTAIDFDNDKSPEFVGSYDVIASKKTRGLLFFIAESGKNGKYKFTKTVFREFKEEDVMSENIKDLDLGYYNDILLDAFDFDNDGQKEIFTVGYGFEGNSYFVYKKMSGSWKKIFETDSYRCGY
jgi:hypothetical protein